MTTAFNHQKVNKTYHKRLQRGKLDVGAPVSGVAHFLLKASCSRKSFAGRSSLRRARIQIHQIKETRELVWAEQAKLRTEAILAEFAWKDEI